MKIHDVLAENRIRFAQKLNEMSDELSNLVKGVEKIRKQVETAGSYLTWTTSAELGALPPLDKGSCYKIRACPPRIRVYGRENQDSIRSHGGGAGTSAHPEGGRVIQGYWRAVAWRRWWQACDREGRRRTVIKGEKPG